MHVFNVSAVKVLLLVSTIHEYSVLKMKWDKSWMCSWQICVMLSCRHGPRSLSNVSSTSNFTWIQCLKHGTIKNSYLCYHNVVFSLKTLTFELIRRSMIVTVATSFLQWVNECVVLMIHSHTPGWGPLRWPGKDSKRVQLQQHLQCKEQLYNLTK